MKNLIQSTGLEKKKIFFVVCLSTFILYFIFAPAVNALYYAGDAYRYAFGGISKACKLDDGFEYMFTLGRPIQAYLDCAIFKFAYTLERMSYVRIVSVILLGCSMGLLIDWLIRLRFSLITAFFVAGVFTLIPEMYFDAILTGSQPLPFAILLVLLAYRVNHQEVKNSLWWSSGLLFCSMLTYPAMAFFFLTLSLTKLLFSPLCDWRSTKRQIIQEITLFIAVSVIYYICAYCNMHFFPKAPVTDVAYQLNHPNLNLKEIFERIYLLLNVFDKIWSLTPLTNMIWQGWIMIVLFTGGILISFVNFFRYQDSNKYWILEAVFVAAILLFLCSLFILVMPSRVFQPRLLIGAITAGLALMLWSLSKWSKIFPGYLREKALLVMCAIVFIFVSYQTNMVLMVYGFSYNQYFNFTKNSISNYLSSHKLKRIHFIVSRDSYPYDKFFLTNGALMQLLGRNQYNLQWCSLSRGTSGEEKDHQKEMLDCIQKLPLNTIGITYTYGNEIFKDSENMLVLDMQNISPSNYAEKSFKSFFNLDIKSDRITY